MKKKIALALTLSSLSGTAALANTVSAQLYRSPFNLNYGMLESPLNDNLLDNKVTDASVFVSANYNFAKDPIIVKDLSNGNRISSLVGSYNTVDLSAGYLFQPNLALFAQLPISNAKLPGSSSGTVLGDSRLDLKIGLTEEKDSAVSFAVMPEVTFPTGSKTYFLTDNGVTAGLLLVAEKTFDTVRVAANLGYRYSSSADYLNINYHNRIPYGIGGEFRLAQKWSLSPEFSGFFSTPTSNHQNPGEFFLGVNHHPRNDIALIAGASVGTTDRQASLNYRGILALRMFLTKPAKAVEAPKPAPAPVVAKLEPAPAPVKPRVIFSNKKIETLDTVNFENDKDVLTSSGKTVLDDVSRVVLEHRSDISHLSIEGHTSLSGSQKHNDDLSLRRAKRVKEYLVDKGVDAKILGVKGYGKQKPKYLPGKSTKEEQELNRRVEFIVTPAH